MIIRLWVLATTWAHCVESLSKILKLWFVPPLLTQVKKEMGYRQVFMLGRQNRLVCAGGVAYPTTKISIEESGLSAKEIEMSTTAESLELWVLILPLTSRARSYFRQESQNRFARILLSKSKLFRVENQ